jgi:hypothetical protein
MADFRSTAPSLVLSCTSKQQPSRLSESGIPPDHSWEQILPAHLSDFWWKGDLSTSRATGNSFISIASAAKSFRPTGGPNRGAPQCSKQRFPEATRHAGQGSERSVCGAKSFILIGTGCDETCRKTVPFSLPNYSREARRRLRENFTSPAARSPIFNRKPFSPIKH